MLRALVPGVLLIAGWAVVTHGGVLDQLREAEAAAAATALRLAEGALDSALTARGGEVVRFAPPGRPGRSPASLAEAQGLATSARGDVAGALAFLRHAAPGGLSAAGWLALARLDGSGEAARAAAAAEPDAALGGVPVPVLARLAVDDAGLLPALAAGEVALPAAAVAPVLAALGPTVASSGPARTLRAAARAWLDRDPAAWPPRRPLAGPDGCVLLPGDGDAVRVLAADDVAEVRRDVLRAVAQQQPQLTVAVGDGGLARAHVAALGETWTAAPRGTPVSTWVERAALLMLVLGIGAVVFGNVAQARVARRELQLARLRSEFVDLVSHELRTPLSAMSMRAEMLARGEVPAGRLPHYLHTLHLDVRRLADQVQRVLDFARLESAARPVLAQTTVRAAVARGVREGAAALRLVGQRLRVDVPRDLPPVELDAEVVARAVRNLLENAARHAPSGGEVELAAHLAPGGEVWIEVRDRGPGVPADERSAIFEPFRRGRGAAASGSGLGLALVARAAALHGGVAEVAARSGGGSCFRLRLPLRAGTRRRVS